MDATLHKIALARSLGRCIKHTKSPLLPKRGCMGSRIKYAPSCPNHPHLLFWQMSQTSRIPNHYHWKPHNIWTDLFSHIKKYCLLGENFSKLFLKTMMFNIFRHCDEQSLCFDSCRSLRLVICRLYMYSSYMFSESVWRLVIPIQSMVGYLTSRIHHYKSHTGWQCT